MINGKTGLLADMPPMICAGTVLSHPGVVMSIRSQYTTRPSLTSYHNAGVDGLCSDHLLGVHAHQIAQEHAGGRREALCNADGGEVNCQSSCQLHAPFGSLDELWSVSMAYGESSAHVRSPVVDGITYKD